MRFVSEEVFPKKYSDRKSIAKAWKWDDIKSITVSRTSCDEELKKLKKMGKKWTSRKRVRRGESNKTQENWQERRIKRIRIEDRWGLKCSSDGPLQAEREIKMQGWKHIYLSLCVMLSIITVKWQISVTYRRAARGERERCVFRLSLRVT